MRVFNKLAIWVAKFCIVFIQVRDVQANLCNPTCMKPEFGKKLDFFFFLPKF